jgi:hypothetical protein
MESRLMAAGVVFAVGMVKDEADVIGHTVDHLFSEGVDGVIVADNGSTDGTRDLLAARKTQGAALEIVDDPELGYYQAEKMSRLAERAHRLGAEWVIPFDADELWWSWSGTVGATLRRAKRETKVVEAHLWNYFPTDLVPADRAPAASIPGAPESRGPVGGRVDHLAGQPRGVHVPGGRPRDAPRDRPLPVPQPRPVRS